MNTYLAIITTVLVVTQIIRLIQNAVQLHRQNVLFKKQLGQLANCEPTEEDFETRRKANLLIVEYLNKKRCKDWESIQGQRFIEGLDLLDKQCKNERTEQNRYVY